MASPTVVQSNWVQASSSQNPAPSLSGVTAGNILLAVAAFASGSNGQSFGVPTDSAGQTWPAAIATQVTANAPYGQGAQAFSLASANAGTHTVTFSNSTGFYCFAGLIEIAGASGGVDKKVAGSGSGTTFSLTSGTLASAAELAIAIMGITPVSPAASMGITDPPTGWTSLYAAQANTNDQFGEAAYIALSSTASVSPSWSWTTGTSAAAGVLITFAGTAPTLQYQPLPYIRPVILEF